MRGCPKTEKPNYCHSVLDTESKGGDEVVWILAFARMTFSDSLFTHRLFNVSNFVF